MQRYYGRAPLDLPTDRADGPFRCDGYLAQGEIRDGQGRGIPLADLPPFLRALLVTDGTVTKILEAYFWEPVAVDTLEQRFETATAPVPWIALERGGRCLIRDARLRGLHSGRHFAEAFSLIRTELIPEDFRRRLIDREIGIGALIRDSGLESYREVLDVGLEAEPGGLGSVYRTYRIVIGRHPVILITEYFPLHLYLGA
jgi:chorismate-pyruvate lyase